MRGSVKRLSPFITAGNTKMAKAQLYIVLVIDGDDGDGEYCFNAIDVRFARRAAIEAHIRETDGAYCEVHSVMGPFDYDEESPLASAGEFAKRDHRGRNIEAR